MTAGAWQALYLSHDSFDTTTYSSFSFWVHGGASGGQLLQVTGLRGGASQTAYNLPALAANTWQHITIPLASLGVAASPDFSGFYIQDRTGTAQPVFYVDDARLVATVPAPSVAHITVNAAQTVRTVDARVFGVNTAIWDSNLETSETISLLNEMGNQTLRFPGGSAADDYNWATGMSGTNTWAWATNFANFAHVASGTQLHAAYITVNYGSGTPQEAANWVTYSNITLGCGFKYWEVGNELYGTWETDNNTRPHDPFTYATRFKSYYAEHESRRSHHQDRRGG